jgi:hypothetical protein
MGVVRPFEVKHLNRDFHCLEDLTKGKSGERGQWPLLIVDTVEHVSRNVRFYSSVAERYWFWNKEGSAAVWLDVETSIPWWVRQWNKVDGRWRQYYMIPLFWDADQKIPIYNRQHLQEFWLKNRRWPGRMIGVNFMTGKELDEQLERNRQNVKTLHNMLEGTRWMNRGEVQEENPGKPKS